MKKSRLDGIFLWTYLMKGRVKVSYYTAEGLKTKKELDYLKSVERQKPLKLLPKLAIKRFSENAEYDAAKSSRDYLNENY